MRQQGEKAERVISSHRRPVVSRKTLKNALIKPLRLCNSCTGSSSSAKKNVVRVSHALEDFRRRVARTPELSRGDAPQAPVVLCIEGELSTPWKTRMVWPERPQV
eukprot:scaffold1355_cov268-Pinguiococcus_pyrenoidosus.AAC.60